MLNVKATINSNPMVVFKSHLLLEGKLVLPRLEITFLSLWGSFINQRLHLRSKFQKHIFLQVNPRGLKQMFYKKKKKDNILNLFVKTTLCVFSWLKTFSAGQFQTFTLKWGFLRRLCGLETKVILNIDKLYSHVILTTFIVWTTQAKNKIPHSFVKTSD